MSSPECQACRYDTPYKQHYNENKQSHHPSAKRANTTLLTNNIITKINSTISRVPSVHIQQETSNSLSDKLLLLKFRCIEMTQPLLLSCSGCCCCRVCKRGFAVVATLGMDYWHKRCIERNWLLAFEARYICTNPF